MKKLNIVCASIVAMMSANVAYAGVATVTPNTVAVENFGGSTSAATDTVYGGAISLSLSNIAAVNSGATVYFTVRLAGGLFANVPAVGQFTFAGATCTAAGAAPAPLCTVTRSTDRSTVLVAVQTQANVTLGLGAFGFTPAATDINAVNTTLATVGNSVTATIGLQTLAPTSIEATATQTTIDAPLATGALVTSARGINGAIAASSYTGRIDLTASPAGSNYTTPGYAILGQLTFTDSTTPANQRGSLTVPYTLAAGSANTANTGVVAVVTPGTGQAFPVGSTLFLSASNTCGSVFGTSTTAAATGTTAVAARTITATGAAVATGTPYFVCMSAPSTGNTASPIQPTITATVTPAATTDSIAAATGTGYSLDFNGSSVDVLTYWPGALDAFSYKGYLRITNTGTVTANVSFAHVNKDNGALFNSAVIMANLAPGESRLISSVAIDAVAGAAPSNLESGRARVTAPTNGLRVQSLLQTGNDAPIEYRANNGL